MTQEEKELLLKDICTRLPYNVMVRVEVNDVFIKPTDEVATASTINMFEYPQKFRITPYLRPMSSMTLDELDDCVTNDGLSYIPCPNYEGSKEECEQQRLEHSIKVFKTDGYRVDWLNKNMFDYRGLIEKGLALEAPEGMYEIK